MTSVKPLYDHVRATVLEGLRREWQRYGWEDSEIDDKVDKLAKLWAAALHSTGAVTEPPQPPQPASTAADDGKDDDSADGKRKRKREDRPGEKRFKSGPRVDAPLTYPTFPPASAAAASAHPVPAALASGYVPRFSAPSPSPPPQPPSAATAATEPHAMQTDIPVAASDPPPAQPHLQPTPSVHTSSTTTATTTTATSSAPSQLIKPEPSLPPIPYPAAPTSPAPASSNPLLTEPLSALDDDRSVDVDLGAVGDVVLCQYERVSHVKGRWKVVMRDGIVSVKGKEYAFSRMTGELQW